MYIYPICTLIVGILALTINGYLFFNRTKFYVQQKITKKSLLISIMAILFSFAILILAAMLYVNIQNQL
ncbi:hypothetical protein CUN34_03835 [Enterococcus faecium]|uniref:Uncharacterized protein n=1 Tax=Enterococcus faecium TaxID=1352 RepID=A0A2S7R9R1_ENTFC|nr:hypothetical protein [Enterococcus faecium]EOF77223.1 hypothetical protein SGC_02170 [Enterococcus faecium EnGen0136]EGP5220911.1 hypothetical protein [Enterococcus faecium]EGP5273780.1 hypothetical protein [Enterococcus faecium]PCD94901.1 hypothetical protein CKY16_05065 [Enterococcus faecium]